MKNITHKNGTIFKWIANTLQTTNSGKPFQMVSYMAHCRKCNEPFFVTSVLKPTGRQQRVFDLVHCKAHRISAIEALALARESRAANKILRDAGVGLVEWRK
jgi:hypothetical protein